MKVTKPATLGTLEFDAIIERSETLESEVPQYATESGYSISDNICLKAVSLDVEAVFSNSPVTWSKEHAASSARVEMMCEELRKLWKERAIMTFTVGSDVYENISGTFTFSFSIERNATSGDVGTVSSSSKFSKKLTVTSYDDAINKMVAALQGFKAFESFGVSVKTVSNEKDQNVIVLTGAKESDSFSSSTCEYVTIVRVTSNILFESVDYGNFIHANNTITKIVTNIDGFESVANRITPNSGHLEQTDAEARSSYIDRLANRAHGTVASIVSILYSDVEGVTYATGYQNDTDETDADGRPPHSIEIVVQGGSDAAVANVIWKNKAAGIRAYGSYYSYATDMNGNSQYLEFTRVKTVYLLLSIKITSAGGLDDDYEERIKALLSNESPEVGKPIRLQRLIRPILENISGVDYVEIRGTLNEKSDVSSVEDSSMAVGVVAVSKEQQPLIVANGIRIVKVS